MENATLAARPFIRWAGGKTYLLPEIKKRIPSAWNPETDLYVEPFLGAGALFWGLNSRRAYLNDYNAELITTYCQVRSNYIELEAMLCDCEVEYATAPELYYYQMRALKPARDQPALTAARFIFLNKTCFNGLYRVNRGGEFNVPWNGKARVSLFDPATLKECCSRLQTATLTVADFANMSFDPKGALIYCDPPYIPISKTSNFTSYTADGFTYYDQLRLAVWAADMRDAGAHIALSQAAYEPLIDQYRHLGFTCDLVQVPRRVNSQGTGRGLVGEYLIY